MNDRDQAGRRILGRSSSSDAQAGGSTPAAPTRPILGRSSKLLGGSGASGSPMGSNSSEHATSLPVSARRKFRPRLRTAVVGCAVLIVLLPMGVVALGWWQFSRISTVNVASALSARGSRNGTNYLVVGTDSRAGPFSPAKYLALGPTPSWFSTSTTQRPNLYRYPEICG